MSKKSRSDCSKSIQMTFEYVDNAHDELVRRKRKLIKDSINLNSIDNPSFLINKHCTSFPDLK